MAPSDNCSLPGWPVCPIPLCSNVLLFTAGMPRWLVLGVGAVLWGLCFGISPLPAQLAAPDLIAGYYDTESGSFEDPIFLNDVLGWRTFFDAGFLGQSTIVANVEAGHVWGGHEVFLRPEGSGVGLTTVVNGTGVGGEVDFHATMVGHVLAGTGYVPESDPASYTFVGLGMAPLAELWSGAVATSYSSTQVGAFSTTTESVVSVYREFFNGVEGRKPDVINSSWGGVDPAAVAEQSVALDGLAAGNATVAFVVSAGNSGTTAVGSPGSGYNNLTIGSLGGASYLEPSTFSSRGAVDFYNPESGITLEGVRVGVDLAAPGELLFLAAYLGPSGGLAAADHPSVTDSSPDDLYFVNSEGTSFSAPIVAGGIALLKDAANRDSLYQLTGVPAAQDTRVIKSVLMAGTRTTVGWDNGQEMDSDGVVRTIQALDYATGAGAMDLDQAVEVYLLSGTRDVAGDGGGVVDGAGWDFGSVNLEGFNDYVFLGDFAEEVRLSVSLNWFAGRTYDDENNLAADLSFSDLNLQVWQVLDGVFSVMVAESASLYNNTEFLRVDLPVGHYGLRVTFHGLIYDVSEEGVTSESYGIAWRAQAVPEPGTAGLVMVAAGFLLWRLRRPA